MAISKAKKSLVRIKLGIGGISGSGKTMSSLLLAYGLVHADHPEWTDEQVWDKICVVDTENRSANLFVDERVGNVQIGEFCKIDITPPFGPQKYIDAIDEAQRAGMEFLIIDSLTHAWTGEGGLLEMQANAAKRSGNSYTAWRDVTPLHNKLIDKILQCDMHVIITARSKKEYAMEEENGRKKVVQKGMGIQFRDGLEYEVTTFFELDQNHQAAATKDRTRLFDGQYFVITPEIGAKIHGWLTKAKPEDVKAAPAPIEKASKPAPAAPVSAPMPTAVDTENQLPFDEPPAPTPASIITMDVLDATIRAAAKTTERAELLAKIKGITGGTANYKAIKDQAIIEALYAAFAA